MTGALLLLLAAQLGNDPMNDPAAQYEEHTYTYTGGDYNDEVFRYRLLKPAKIEEGKKYPVVLFLHGAGERGDDNRSQLQYLPLWMAEQEYREKFPCFVIAPQCRAGEKWVDVDWSSQTSGLPENPSHQMAVAVAVLDEALEKYPIDPDRQYLTGLSMGGYGSWDLAMRQPDRFAAVVPICGGGDESEAARLKDVKVWCFHGEKDDAVPVARSRRMIEAIRSADGEPKYTEFPGVGHNSWTPAYRDPATLEWIFAQKREKRATKRSS